MPLGTHVHDLRHRFSCELRPSAEFDARLRALAHELEARELIAPGAASAPRFHPHITLLRSATSDEGSALAASAALAGRATGLSFDLVGTFGGGRIVTIEPTDTTLFHAVRAAAIAQVASEDLDPLVTSRAWTPHLTLAYSVPEAARDDTRRHIAAALPLRGAFASVEIWDLDVRPTRLVHRVCIDPPAL